MPWYVLYTKPRQEKKVADGLIALGIDAYCPLVTTIKQWSDRKKKVEVPLLTSYVFVNIAADQRDAVFEVSGIVRYLFWLGQPAVVREDEILSLQSWLSTTAATIAITPIQPGERIFVPCGPFEGQEGLVHKLGKHTIELFLTQLGIKLVMTRV